jgi:hypothetical protein
MTRRSPRSHALAALAALALLLAPAREAAACYQWAEAVVAFDLAADLYVLATWHERERPPQPLSSVVPNWYELMRISTGEKVASHKCHDSIGMPEPAAPVLPCDWRQGLAAALPKTATWQRSGRPLATAGLRVRPVKMGYDTAMALETRGPRGWQRVTFFEYASRGWTEKVTYKFGASERAQGRVGLFLEAFSRGGNCTNTTVHAVLLDEADWKDPARPGRQAHLLAGLGASSPFEQWFTAAELAPLPADKLLTAMAVAEREARIPTGVRWWREATAALPAARIAALSAELRKRKDLEETVRVLHPAP